MRISDWSADVCSSDLCGRYIGQGHAQDHGRRVRGDGQRCQSPWIDQVGFCRKERMMKRTTQLRRLLAEGGPGVVPGATDCFTARLIEQAGFPVVYVTGGGTANTYLGGPDIGLVTLNELAGQVERIADAVSVPVIADCDTGFGGVANVKRTIRAYERAGAAR